MKILLRAGKSPFQALSPEASVVDYPSAVFAVNVGNTVFSDAVHRILSIPGTDVVPNTYLGERQGVTPAYLDAINERFDHFVIPLANAFRPAFLPVLRRLTETMEGMKIPVTIVGVGVGGGANSLGQPADDVGDDMKQVTRRFMKAALDRSSRVGVRGENTRAYLRSLGFGDDKVEVIGCPSMFRFGPDLQVEKSAGPLKPDDPISINITPYVPEMGECALRHGRIYDRLVYIPQDLETLQTLLKAEASTEVGPDMPFHKNHDYFREGRIRYFVESRNWIEFLKTVRFSFGTRIHGNIAAIVGGTPAVVLVHDTRTQELVNYHRIPFRRVADGARLDAAQLFDEAEFGPMNAAHRQNFETFHRFMAENGLKTVFDPQQANPDYDRRLEQVRLAEPVESGTAATIRSLPWRLRQKWRRHSYRFTAPVPHQPVSPFEKLVAGTSRVIGL